MAEETPEELKRRLETRVLRAAHGALDLGERLWRIYKFFLKLIRYFFLTLLALPFLVIIVGAIGFAGSYLWNYGLAEPCTAYRQALLAKEGQPEVIEQNIRERGAMYCLKVVYVFWEHDLFARE
jgi:hypothetical protein